MQRIAAIRARLVCVEVALAIAFSTSCISRFVYREIYLHARFTSLTSLTNPSPVLVVSQRLKTIRPAVLNP